MTRGFCRAAIAVASVIVPAGERAAWRAEWTAEMDHSWSHRSTRIGRRLSLTGRTLSALAHAAWMRKESVHMDNVMNDIRFAARMLVRQPAFAVAAVLTLALGIGANTAIFSIVNSTLLAPLPFGHPAELMQVWETLPAQDIFENTPAPSTVDLWRERSGSATAFAAYTSSTQVITSDGEPEKLLGVRASANLLQVLEAQPVLGRGFVPEEDREGGPKVVMLTGAFWARRFRRDPTIVGRTIRLNGEATLVIGILPDDLPLSLRAADVWVPLALQAREGRDGRMLWVVARTRPGVTAPALQAELDAVMHRPGPGKMDDGIGVHVLPIDEELRGGVRPDLLMVFGVSAVVLLIACTNVATMLLGRGIARRGELALRLSLGAGRGRLVRMLLTESALLGAIGGAVGLAVGAASLQIIQRLMPPALALELRGGLDERVVLFSAGLSLVTALVFSLVPIAGVASGSLMLSARGSSEREQHGSRTLRSTLIVAEVALAVVLLSASALLVRAFATIVLTPTGFSTDAVLTAQVPREEVDDAKRTAFYAQLLDTMRALPGVRVAGLTNGVPLRWLGGGSGFQIDDGKTPAHFVSAHHRVVSAGYLDALSIPILRGHDFSGHESPDGELVCIVSKEFAENAWAGADPIGHRIRWGGDGPWFSVIGVAGDIRLTRSLAPEPHIYVAFTQIRVPFYPPSEVVLKTAGDPGALVGALRDAVRRIDPYQPVATIVTMDQLLSQSVGRRRFTLTLMSTFAGLALVLAAIGIYGVLSYSVRRRRREIGVRLAVGATIGRVRRDVLREGLSLAVLGAIAGLAASALLARWAASIVPSLPTLQPLPLAGAALLLLAVAAIACDIPARRAMRVDPMTALRTD